jgi:plasmid stabilization system protein ParE
MVKRIIWSKNALRDKVRILDYWYRKIGTKTYSRKLDTQLRQAVKGLKDFPEMGRQIENTDIKFLVKDYYQIFYKFSKNEIKVLHI